jgi:hypothetical protein
VRKGNADEFDAPVEDKRFNRGQSVWQDDSGKFSAVREGTPPYKSEIWRQHNGCEAATFVEGTPPNKSEIWREHNRCEVETVVESAIPNRTETVRQPNFGAFFIRGESTIVNAFYPFRQNERGKHLHVVARSASSECTVEVECIAAAEKFQ